MRWTQETCIQARDLWQQLGSAPKAAQEMGKRLGCYVSVNGMKDALLRMGISAGSLGLESAIYGQQSAKRNAPFDAAIPPVVQPRINEAPEANPRAPDFRSAVDGAREEIPRNAQDGQANAQNGRNILPAEVQRLVQEAKRAPDFEVLCNRLDLSPNKCASLIERAKAAGVQLHIEHSRIGLESQNPREDVQTVGVPPVVTEPQRVAVLSDAHFGSKYCLREQLTDFVEHAYRSGVREVLCPGDLLDGEYKHGVFEVSHSGLDAQAGDLFDSLPQKPGLNYRAITGNHEGTFSEASGLDVGAFLAQFFRARGRGDLHFYGARGAHLRILGAHVHLWHPRSNMSYARSYALQKQVEKYSSGEKPHILLAGHWHQFCHVHERGVHAVACPTFQGGGSAFAKSIGGAPAIGGLILTWTLTEHATMRDLALEFRAYFEREQAREVA